MLVFRAWQDKDKAMRPPVKDLSTDESGSEAPAGKRTKATRKGKLPKSKGSRVRQRSNRHMVESDMDDNDTDDDAGCRNVVPAHKQTGTALESLIIQSESPSASSSLTFAHSGAGRQSRCEESNAEASAISIAGSVPASTKGCEEEEREGSG